MAGINYYGEGKRHSGIPQGGEVKIRYKGNTEIDKQQSVMLPMNGYPVSKDVAAKFLNQKFDGDAFGGPDAAKQAYAEALTAAVSRLPNKSEEAFDDMAKFKAWIDVTIDSKNMAGYELSSGVTELE